MNTGTRVKNTETGEFGHIIADSFGCCGSEEDMVVYDGTSTGAGTDRTILETSLGLTPTPDMKKCGAGKGEECCIFLTIGSDGSCCERFTSMRDALIFRAMNAKRNPEEPYPECMKFEDEIQ